MNWIILKCDRDNLYIVGKQSHDYTFKAVAECFTFGIAEALVRALEAQGDKQDSLRAPFIEDIELLIGSER